MLYIIATPIGNLEDISLRALRLLGEVDFVLCEDTRVTAKLLKHYEISTKTISFHQHSNAKKMENILALLESGKTLALVTDAGTPGISDPGGKLIEAVIEKFSNEIKVELVPGPSAVTAALSISGIPTDKFMFMGFPPHKKGRQKFLKKIADSVFPVVVYESKHRIIKFLEEIEKLNLEINEHNRVLQERKMKGIPKDEKFGEKRIPVSSVVVCRELSKMHETVYRGDLDYIISQIKNNRDDRKGEFVVIVGK